MYTRVKYRTIYYIWLTNNAPNKINNTKRKQNKTKGLLKLIWHKIYWIYIKEAYRDCNIHVLYVNVFENNYYLRAKYIV